MSGEGLGAPLGDGPHIAVRVLPMCRDPQYSPDGYVGLLGKSAPLGKLHEQLCAKLELPSSGVLLSYEGRSMVVAKTLSENGMVLPGPIQRRAGIMLEILFDVTWEEIERQKQAERSIRQEIALVEAMKVHAENEKVRLCAERLQWERDSMLREEELHQQHKAQVAAQAQAQTAQILAGLPVEMRRIEYSLDWGVIVEERLREIAHLAHITVQECVDGVNIISGRGDRVMELFAGDAVPSTDDFPFVLMFGPIKVEIKGPTHRVVQAIVQERQKEVPRCWTTDGCGANVVMPVEATSGEFSSVMTYFRGTLGWLPEICSLSRVENKKVYSRFKGRGENDLTIMFHGCRSHANEANILKNGFQVSSCVSGGSNYGTWLAYISSYSDSGYVLCESSGIKHLFICVVSAKHVQLDNQTMRVVGQDCAYPQWLVTYRPPAS